MDDNRFRPIAMSKSRLAAMYFPDSAPHTARTRLMRWIAACRPLAQALAETGYNPRQRLLTGRQVRLITEYLDTP